MNSPPGTGPHRPPFPPAPPIFRQVAPAPPSLRIHPVSMLGAHQRGQPTPRAHSHHQPRVHQSFPQPHGRPPFMPPMMHFMPYAMPMGMPMPPHAFPRPFSMPLYSRDRIHHVHHHHHHDTHPHHQGPERAFPSQQVRQRHDQRSSPQVFDPDGRPVGPWDDSGPEVVDLEEGVLGSGMEMVVRQGYAAGYSTSMPSGVTDTTSASFRLDANVSVPVQGLDSSCHPRVVEDLSPDMEGAESEREDSPAGPGMVSVPNDATEHQSSRNPMDMASTLDGSIGGRTFANHVVIVQGVTDGTAHAAETRATASQSTRSLRDDSSSSTAGTSQPPRRTKSLHLHAILPASSNPQPADLVPSSYTSLAPNLEPTNPSPQTFPSTTGPHAIDTAVDRLLETTGMSARQFMRMLEDRAIVRDVERYRDAQVGPRES